MCNPGYRFLVVFLGFALSFILHPNVASAQATPPQMAEQPAKIDEFIKLLGDADIQKWIAARGKSQPVQSEPPVNDAGVTHFLETSLVRIREHIRGLAAAIPELPNEIATAAGRIAGELKGHGAVWMVVLFAIFVGVGLAAQALFWNLSGSLRTRIANAQFDTVGQRLLAITARLIFGAGYVLAFVAGSLGAFLVFKWPNYIGKILIGYLLAVVIYRMAWVFLEFLLSPPRARTIGDAGRFRIVPMSSEAAIFWTRRLSIAVGWFAFGWITVTLLRMLGFSRPSEQLIAYALGIGLLLLGIEAVWRRPPQHDAELSGPGPDNVGTSRKWLATFYFVFLWVLWVAGMMPMFWLAVVAAGLPAAMFITQRAVNNILRPAGAAQGGSEVPSVVAAIIERGARALLIVAAVLILAMALDLEISQLTGNDTLATRLARGAVAAVLVLLLADFFWHVTKTMIDRKLAFVRESGEIGSEDARRRARVRTLLPILRNVLMIVVVVVAVLMALSSLGVEIAPLIAGAGIVGVAIGFGAQTVVKDVISGVFYLLDDAFRVGEYIQSGSYMGVVESFSLRSVKLRHHRGAIYIVPFSELGAVQNMSRDWVIEKITMNVSYDSDVEKARKIIKKIGLELAQDPEFAQSTIEPLKMQGVEFGEFAMVLSMKLKTRPGEQFGIKRRALIMVKQAFSENGVKIAVPTMQVAGDMKPAPRARKTKQTKQAT